MIHVSSSFHSPPSGQRARTPGNQAGTIGEILPRPEQPFVVEKDHTGDAIIAQLCRCPVYGLVESLNIFSQNPRDQSLGLRIFVRQLPFTTIVRMACHIVHTTIGGTMPNRQNGCIADGVGSPDRRWVFEHVFDPHLGLIRILHIAMCPSATRQSALLNIDDIIIMEFNDHFVSPSDCW